MAKGVTGKKSHMTVSVNLPMEKLKKPFYQQLCVGNLCCIIWLQVFLFELNQLLVLVLGHDFQVRSPTEKTYKQVLVIQLLTKTVSVPKNYFILSKIK